MDGNLLSNTECYTTDNNLESFSIIWLDSNSNITDSRKTDEKLRHIINHLRKFQDAKQCQQYIEQRSEEHRLVIITSGVQGQLMVPHIHHLRQVSSIYIYCMEKYENQQWTHHFSKVKGVITESDELIIQIKKDQEILHKIEEPLSIRVFTLNDSEDKSTTNLNGKFVYSQLLLDCILRIKPNEDDKNELISLLKHEYTGNSFELAKVYDFEKNYSKEKVLWWYTRESFFYKTLNKALRTQNIHMIYLFRSYINDLCYKLQEKQSDDHLKVYRCQLMSKDELNNLSEHMDQFISINSFFSTSLQQHVASFYMGDGNPQDNLQRVLFEIDAYPQLNNKKSFADISLFSEFSNESEVLFTLGSIFRLNKIYLDKEHLWKIQLSLYADEEHDLKQIFSQMKVQNGIGEINLLTLAKFLSKMGKFQLAEEYCDRLIKQLPSDDPFLITLYEDLANITSQKGDYDKSLQCQMKLSSLRQSTISIDTVSNIENTESYVSLSQSSPTVIKKRKMYPNGDVYDGETLNNLYHGYGVYTWRNGDHYEGMWEKNCREGQGTWTWGEETPSAGDRYSGQWHVDKKHGYGQYFQANGDTYTGEFKEDHRHGSGIYRMQNGQCLKVVYDQDELISSEKVTE